MNTNGIRLMAEVSRGGNVGDGRGTKCFGRRAVKGLGIGLFGLRASRRCQRQ